MLTEISASLLGGLGLFFIGVKLLSGHMKQLAGRRFREMVTLMTRSRLRASALGVLSGCLTQSSNAVTFIVVSLLSSGMLTMGRALPVVGWSNVGTSLLVILATLDLRLVILYLLGAIGLAHYMDWDKSSRLRHLVGAALGLALLFLGLVLIKAGAAPLKDLDAVQTVLRVTSSSMILAFIAGAALSFVAQSSSTVSVVAVTMVNVGLLTMDQTLMIVYGANLGSGLSIWLLAANLRGTLRQVALYQVLLKSVGAFLFVCLFYFFKAMPSKQLLDAATGMNLSLQVALVFLALQTVPALIFTLLNAPILKLLGKLCAPSREEELASPHFLYDQAFEEPGLAAQLVAREQGRLISFLPEYLDAWREEPEKNSIEQANLYDRAGQTLSVTLDTALSNLIDHADSRDTTEELIKLQMFQNHVKSLQESLRELVHHTGEIPSTSQIRPLSLRMIEGLHALLSVFADAAIDPENAEPKILVSMTADRSDFMDRTRRKFQESEAKLKVEEQQRLYAITTIFERIVWLVRRLVMVQPAFSQCLALDAKRPVSLS